MEPLLVSVAEACRLLGVARTTIYAMIADGRLEAVKVRRRRLVRVASIRAVAEQADAA